MILLLGGTSETRPLALMLARAGHQVLVSTATAIELDTGSHQHIRRRCGRLNAADMAALIREERITAVVDAAHPFAAELHATARRACAAEGVRLLRFKRPSLEPGAVREDIHWAVDHHRAAELACSLGNRILLTIGSKNIAPYIQTAKGRGIALFARVLPEADSVEACCRAGLLTEQVIAARGPFSLEDNLSVLRSLRINVLVSKESGVVGGLKEKIRAACLEKSRMVIVQRPVEVKEAIFYEFSAIVRELDGLLMNH